MNFIRKSVSLILIVLFLSSCGISKRMYFTSDKKIAISPRGYTATSYKKLDTNSQGKIQKRNRTMVISLIVSANALIFFPLLMSQQSEPAIQ